VVKAFKEQTKRDRERAILAGRYSPILFVFDIALYVLVAHKVP
jgi:hypothetical protein